MRAGVAGLLEEAERLSDQRRILPAIATWEEARRLTQLPAPRALVTFNIGVTYWMRIGDGARARREFLETARMLDTADPPPVGPLRVLHANAIENAMLCALSYGEFERLAVRLRAIAPDAPILAGLLPQAAIFQEAGKPWSDMLFLLAGSYYNRNDPRFDRGRYGEAKSTYHLLLAHRRELRVGREDWAMATYEYAALALRMATDCATARGDDFDPFPPEEYLPILTEALPFVDEYLAANAGDDNARGARDNMATVIDTMRSAAARSHGATPSPASAEAAAVVAAAVLAAIIGCGFAWACLDAAPHWLRALGAAVAAIMGFLIGGTGAVSALTTARVRD